MDALRCNYTGAVVDRPTDRKIVDSQCVFKINHLSDGYFNQFNAQLVANGGSQI
jgi:hypothetical protein